MDPPKPPPDLACCVCGRLLRRAVLTPCCAIPACEICATDQLAWNRNRCWSDACRRSRSRSRTGSRARLLLGDLIPDRRRRARASDFLSGGSAGDAGEIGDNNKCAVDKRFRTDEQLRDCAVPVRVKEEEEDSKVEMRKAAVKEERPEEEAGPAWPSTIRKVKAEKQESDDGQDQEESKLGVKRAIKREHPELMTNFSPPSPPCGSECSPPENVQEPQEEEEVVPCDAPIKEPPELVDLASSSESDCEESRVGGPRVPDGVQSQAVTSLSSSSAVPKKSNILCLLCHAPDHRTKECPTILSATCRTCGVKGHLAFACPRRRRNKKKDSSSVESLDGEEAWIRKVTEDLELRKEGHQERQGHRKRKKSKLKARSLQKRVEIMIAMLQENMDEGEKIRARSRNSGSKQDDSRRPKPEREGGEGEESGRASSSSYSSKDRKRKKSDWVSASAFSSSRQVERRVEYMEEKIQLTRRQGAKRGGGGGGEQDLEEVEKQRKEERSFAEGDKFAKRKPRKMIRCPGQGDCRRTPSLSPPSPPPPPPHLKKEEEPSSSNTHSDWMAYPEIASSSEDRAEGVGAESPYCGCDRWPSRRKCYNCPTFPLVAASEFASVLPYDVNEQVISLTVYPDVSSVCAPPPPDGTTVKVLPTSGRRFEINPRKIRLGESGVFGHIILRAKMKRKHEESGDVYFRTFQGMPVGRCQLGQGEEDGEEDGDGGKVAEEEEKEGQRECLLPRKTGVKPTDPRNEAIRGLPDLREKLSSRKRGCEEGYSGRHQHHLEVNKGEGHGGEGQAGMEDLRGMLMKRMGRDRGCNRDEYHGGRHWLS